MNQQFKIKPKLSSLLTESNPIQLGEIFDNIYELQKRLGLSEEHMLSTSRLDPKDHETVIQEFEQLLGVFRQARERLIIWYLKYNLTELNVTISLLTAKIKLVEFKLGQCDGLDLHQACSLSLVDFCNILADMTVLSVEPAERKTMHKISEAANVPVWLSHYRNQICHVPSESPCISILVPLVARALDYMRDSFWVKIVESASSFDEELCESIIMSIANQTNIIVLKKKLQVKNSDDQENNKVQSKDLKRSEIAISRANCRSLRKIISQHPAEAMDVLIKFMISYSPSDQTKNFSLLLEQIILARQFENLIMRLIDVAECHQKFAWLIKASHLICAHKGDQVKKSLKMLGLSTSLKMKRLTKVPPLKCCHIAYKLMKMEHPIGRRLVIRMRHNLVPVLGKQRTLLLLRLTRLVRA